MQTPVDTATTSSSSGDFRHISPLPDKKYQISSTERCRTATDVCPAANSKVGEATAPHLQENANIGSVGGDGISNRWQWLCLEPSLHAAPKRRGKTRRSGIDMLVRCDAEVKVAATYREEAEVSDGPTELATLLLPAPSGSGRDDVRPASRR
jgi:hypothetical protein